MNIQNTPKAAQTNGKAAQTNGIVAALAAEAALGQLSLDIPAMMARGLDLQTAIALYQTDMAAKVSAAKTAARPVAKMSCKVSEKGALSVYGLGRFPVTLYRGQWERLLADENVAMIRQFIANNAATLVTKEG